MAKPTLSDQKWFLAFKNWGHLLVDWLAAAGLTWLLQERGRLAAGPSPGPLPWQLTCLHGSQPSPDAFLTWLSSHLEEGRCCYSEVDGSRGVKCSHQERGSCCARWTLLSHVEGSTWSACQAESCGMPWGRRVPQPFSAAPKGRGASWGAFAPSSLFFPPGPDCCVWAWVRAGNSNCSPAQSLPFLLCLWIHLLNGGGGGSC